MFGTARTWHRRDQYPGRQRGGDASQSCRVSSELCSLCLSPQLRAKHFSHSSLHLSLCQAALLCAPSSWIQDSGQCLLQLREKGGAVKHLISLWRPETNLLSRIRVSQCMHGNEYSIAVPQHPAFWPSNLKNYAKYKGVRQQRPEETKETTKKKTLETNKKKHKT